MQKQHKQGFFSYIRAFLTYLANINRLYYVYMQLKLIQHYRIVFGRKKIKYYFTSGCGSQKTYIGIQQKQKYNNNALGIRGAVYRLWQGRNSQGLLITAGYIVDLRKNRTNINLKKNVIQVQFSGYAVSRQRNKSKKILIKL